MFSRLFSWKKSKPKMNLGKIPLEIQDNILQFVPMSQKTVMSKFMRSEHPELIDRARAEEKRNKNILDLMKQIDEQLVYYKEVINAMMRNEFDLENFVQTVSRIAMDTLELQKLIRPSETEGNYDYLHDLVVAGRGNCVDVLSDAIGDIMDAIGTLLIFDVHPPIMEYYVQALRKLWCFRAQLFYKGVSQKLKKNSVEFMYNQFEYYLALYRTDNEHNPESLQYVRSLEAIMKLCTPVEAIEQAGEKFPKSEKRVEVASSRYEKALGLQFRTPKRRLSKKLRNSRKISRKRRSPKRK